MLGVTSFQYLIFNLEHTRISNDSLTYIIENVHHTLEKLNVRYCYGITYTVWITIHNITKLKSMPKLRVLNYGRMGNFPNHEQENLKTLMPLVRFGESICVVERELLPADGIWDVEAKQIEYFKKFAKFQFEKLPIKAMLRIANFLERKDLVKVGQVSKKMKCIIQIRMIQNRR